MKVNFLVEAKGAKKHICIVDQTGKPCRLVSSVFIKDRFHPRFGKREYFAHILSPLISVADLQVLMLGLWRRLKSATPGEVVEIGLGFSVLWQEVISVSPSLQEPTPAPPSEPSPFLPRSGGLIIDTACTCGDYVARSTRGLIDTTCLHCGGTKNEQRYS